MEKKLYIKEDGVRFRKSPDTLSDGNIIRGLSKGQELIFILSQEPWIKVKIGNEEGWVHSDYVIDTTPITHSLAFVVGKDNLATDAVAIKLREAIGDEFGGGKENDHLNCTEYVQYRVKEKLGVTIKWPTDRPRNGGKWADIFERNSMYKILAEPKANCAMCFTTGISTKPEINAIGHVAFVEEVLPNNSIIISEANWPRDGIYSERPIPQTDWKNKYKARFIDFS